MKKIYGILCVVISSIAFGIMPIIVKIAVNNGMNMYSILFYRFSMAVILLFLLIKLKHYSLRLSKKQMLYTILLGVLGYSFTSISLFLSYNYISVGTATTIHFLYPAIVTISTIIFFKDKLSSRKLIALLLSLIGVYMLIGGTSSSFNIKGVSLAALSSVFYSLYIIGISNNEIRKINNYVLTFYISLISSMVMLLFGNVMGGFSFALNPIQLFLMIGLAFISTVLALIMFVAGVKVIGPSNASILSTLEPIVSIILGVLVLGEILTPHIIIGCCFILMSVAFLSIKK